MRVLAVSSIVLACAAFGALGVVAPVGAADTTDPAAEPTPIPVSPFVELAAGDQHACGRTSTGAVWCWHYGVYGQLGDGTSDGAYQAPVEVVDLPAARSIAAGGDTTCAVDRGGGLWCWGANAHGQVGDGSTEDRWRPVRVSGLDRGVVGVSSNDERTCAVLDDGSARCWGDNGDGVLGNGTEVSSSVPVRVTVVSEPVEAISAGQWHTCALGTSGTVWCWGSNWEGALGAGDLESHDGAVRVGGIGGSVNAVAAGYMSTCALRDNGAVYCWGDNTGGILGVGSSAANVPSPQRVVELPPSVATIGGSTFGDSHYAALTDGGSVWTWGKNDDSEVGGTAPVVDTPLRMETGGIQGLAVGGDFTSVLLDSGDVRWWGDGDPTPRVPWTGAIVSASTGYRPTGPLVPTITTTIPTPADVSTDPPVVGANLLLAAVAMIAFTIALELLNRTLADAEPYLDRRLGPLSRLDRVRARVDAVLARRAGHGRLANALRVLGIAAFYGLVFALLDPTWEPFSLTGLWLVLSFAIACGLVGIADDLASWATARRWGVAGEMSVRPGSLVAAMGSTAATRLLFLVPGVMIGTPEALEVDEAHLDRGQRGRLAAMGLGAVGIVGAVAWLGTLVAAPVASAVPGVAVLVAGLEAFLLLVFAVAVQNGFVQLLAFRDSAGRALLHVNKLAWALALLVVTFVFWHTLVNPRGDLSQALGSTNVQAFLATVGVVLAIAVGVWLIAVVARRRGRAAAAAAPAVVLPAPEAAAPADGPAGTPAPVAAAPVATAMPVAAAAAAAAPVAVAAAMAMADTAPLAIGSMPSVAEGPAGASAVRELSVPAVATAAALASADSATRPAAPAPPVAGSTPTPTIGPPPTTEPPPTAAPPVLPDDGARVPCPRCAEPIQPAARVCRYCGLELTGSGGGGPGTGYPLQVPGNRRLAGPARLTVSRASLELDAGWVDLLADRLNTVVTTIILLGLVLPAVPILVAAADGRFHPERVQGLREALVLIPIAAVVSLLLVRRWRDGRRLPVRTSCPVLAVEAHPAVDAASGLIAAVLGWLLGAVAWLVGAPAEIQAAAGLGGCMVAVGLYLAMAGRTMVVLRAPLDPQRSRSVVLTLKARNRDTATEVVAAIQEAKRRAGSTEVPAP